MFETERAAMLAVMTHADRVVETRNTVPILSNVAITRDDDGLCLRASDLDIELSTRFAAKVGAEFEPFTAPSALLLGIVKKLPAGATLSFQRKGDKDDLTLKSGRSRFQLQTLPERDYPDIKPRSFEWRFSLPAATLISSMAAVAFAISTEETRYYLNGIYMHPTEGGLYFVATDGHRLARRFVPVADTDGLSGMPGIIVPRKTVDVLSKTVDGAEEEVVIEVNTNAIRASCGRMTLTSKLIDGNYPDYPRIIPRENTLTASIDIPTLKETVDRLGVIIEGRDRTMRFNFSEAGALQLTAHNHDAGSAEEEIAYAGGIQMLTAYNGRYVLDAIAALPAKGNVVFSLSAPGNPAILRAEGDRPDNLVILMPMRV